MYYLVVLWMKIGDRDQDVFIDNILLINKQYCWLLNKEETSITVSW